MENHHFYWENALFQWPCSIFFVCLPEDTLLVEIDRSDGQSSCSPSDQLCFAQFRGTFAVRTPSKLQPTKIFQHTEKSTTQNPAVDFSPNPWVLAPLHNRVRIDWPDCGDSRWRTADTVPSWSRSDHRSSHS